MKKILVLIVMAAAACGGGSKSTKTTTPPAGKTLYDRLGGEKAVTAVVDDFVANVAADDKIKQRFANANIDHLKQMLVLQICSAAGGGCQYTGKSMEDAHKGMAITEEEFNALVGDLVKSLNKFKVADADQKDLLGALGGMKAQIVGK
jgi:hemoglobin